MDSLLVAHPPAPARWSLLKRAPADVDRDAAFCRICLCPGDELISPCRCKGTQLFVHRSCLDHWRSVKEGTAFSHCTTCKAQFHLRVQCRLEEDRGRRMKFRLLVAGDILLVFLAIQTVIAAIGAKAYLLDKDGQFRNRFADGWVHILTKHPVPFYYCVGVVVFFALVGVFGLILQCLRSPSSGNPFSNNDFPTCFGSSKRQSDSKDDKDSKDDNFAIIVVIVIIFAILGIIYAFVAATTAVQSILKRHHHILVKKELTKDYVVEDLHGVYTPPRMDPEHEQHLKKLQLM